MKKKTYVFTNNQINTDSHTVIVDGDSLYKDSLGYGFVVEEAHPEFHFGFGKSKMDEKENGKIVRNEKGCGIEGSKKVPLCFRIDVIRPGNYEVTVCFEAQGEVLIFAGTRRLVYQENFAKATRRECTFTVNVCDILPENGEGLYEKRCIDLSFLGTSLCLESISYAWINCPTIYLAGDASVKDTTADFPYDTKTSTGGWGQMLPYFMNKIAISNHAKDRKSMEEYRQQGDFALIKSHLRIGDYVLFHFSKLLFMTGDTKDYQNILAEFLEESRAMGAYPIIVTPFCRNIWTEDKKKLLDEQEEYALICRTLGEQYHAPIIELHEISKNFILLSGYKKATVYFREDGYALNDYGAYKIAEFVSKLYKELMNQEKKDAYKKLAQYIKEDTLQWKIV